MERVSKDAVNFVMLIFETGGEGGRDCKITRGCEWSVMTMREGWVGGVGSGVFGVVKV